MMRKKHLPGAVERVKVGGRWFTVPGVPSMTEPTPVAPTGKSGDSASEKPADELTEELTRMVKAAYQ